MQVVREKESQFHDILFFKLYWFVILDSKSTEHITFDINLEIKLLIRDSLSKRSKIPNFEKKLI